MQLPCRLAHAVAGARPSLCRAVQELQEVDCMKCRERLESYLRENGVPYEILPHRQVFTMQEVAAELHVPGRQVAKVILASADDKMVMLVLPAPYRVNTDRVRELVGAREVRRAGEDEFAALFPDCDTGAMPPFGNLYDLPIYVDPSLCEESHIVFRTGTHRESMKLAYDDFARLAQPTVGEFAWQI
jgi:Ala-tRNA(Pro) deacylase